MTTVAPWAAVTALLVLSFLNIILLHDKFRDCSFPFGRDSAPEENMTPEFGIHNVGFMSHSVDREFHVLPKRLITVLGLESSGTKFLASTIAQAIEADPNPLFPDLLHSNNSTMILHVSQPFGFWKSLRKSIPNVTDFIPPIECTKWPFIVGMGPPSPYCFNETGLSERLRMPRRFMLNVTSHVLWYKSRGVHGTAVVIVRDDYAHFRGKLKNHQYREDVALQEDLLAKELFVEAFDRLLSPSEIILVSYETLMSLRTPVLFRLYKQLGIQSTFVPEFSSGNKKYIQDPKGGTEWSIDPGGNEHNVTGENAI